MIVNNDKPQETSSAMASMQYVRILAYIIAVCIFATGIYTELYPVTDIAIIPLAILVPWGMGFLHTWLLDKHPDQADNIVMLAHALVAGVGIAAAGYSLTPTLTFVGLLLTSVLAFGNLYVALLSIVIMMLGSLIGGLFFGFHIIPYADMPPIMTLVSFGGFLIYVSLSALYINDQTHKLLSAQGQILKQQEQAIQVSRKLMKYLSPQVWESIFSGKRDARLQNHRQRLSIFFSDIRGFTAVTEEMPPDSLAEIINYYFDQMSKIAMRYGGTIDKFIGDAILIFFGDPTSKGVKEDALACVSMAIDMRKRMQVLRLQWQNMGVEKPLHIRMGITTGYCHVGNFGSESRMDYTIIGREANLASRLQNVADIDEILISNDTYLLVRDKIMCREKGTLQLRGITHPVQVWQVLDFRVDMGVNPSWVEHEMDGFAMLMDVNKVKNYDKDRIVKALEAAAQKLKNKHID